ncbi:thiol:disulfide interchange protein [Sphingomonas jejuensis]|uniref:Thiol:disulfide interchange protein n=1 Tax=Sphingomonas jejuensis TaxID=904715 RepID=A0ABX0XII7_9SPHN|nr:thioredoxin family protein [Sphingomonas jejuensis]NJC32540.1 thiol:disulfide interchange protein [Sphingomonas jejuensis]
MHLLAWILRLLGVMALVPAMPLAAQNTPNIRAELVAESMSPRAGAPVSLAFVMTPASGWHGYWKNPGDAGIETSVRWTLPPGVTAGPLGYQVPERLLLAGLMQYVYEGAYAHPLDLQVPAGLAPGTRLPIRADLDWLECTREVCVPAKASLSIDLTVGDGQVDASDRARFDAIRARLPRPLGAEARFAAAGDRFRIAVPLPASLSVSDAYFYPLTDGVIDYAAAQQVTRDGDRLVVETASRAGAAGVQTLDGVLALDGGRGFSLSARPGAVPSGGEPLSQVDAAGAMSAGLFLTAFGGALLGGLLLNIMPCVFPILSLKALSLARSGESAAAARRDALAYTAGVVGVCLLLGGVLMALRAGGAAAGWAFQLQDPRVMAVLLLVVLAVALNLAGLFELPALASGGRLAGQGGAGGAFWTGVLAAFVATPCTGPFMGVALGTAVLLPLPAAMAVFAGLGLGLALPFLLIGFVPALRHRLPRPGPWMGRLRRILSVPMFLTALAIAWILGRQAGADGMTIGLGAALLLALGLWWSGRRQVAGRGIWPVAMPAALAALVLALLVQPAPRDAASAATGIAGAEPFSEARLAALRAEGRPVFAYFTADWCITCKVNERTAIDRAEVAQAFRQGNVAVLVGDWTDGDPALGRFLSAHGRSGVPLYLWYPVGSEAPEVLPQVLTPTRVAGLVNG